MEKQETNILALAYLGDAIYEIYVRKYLLKKGIVKVKELQSEAIKYVSAKGQASKLKQLLDNGFFNQEEIMVINRGRNHKGTRHPKGTDIVTYKYATGIEAVIGYLELNNNQKRIDEIMKEVIGD